MKGTCWITALFVCVSLCAQPKIAIIMDDVGYNLDRGMRAARLPAAITLAVLPFTANAQALSQTARDLGKEVILHQPLESLIDRRPAAGTLTLAMSATSIQRNFAQALEWLPNCIGVNNHAGSRFTQDPDSMNALMEVVRFHVADGSGTCRTVSARLLDDVRHRIGLVEKPQFAVGFLRIPGVGRVVENTAAKQRAVNVCNHRTDVTQ